MVMASSAATRRKPSELLTILPLLPFWPDAALAAPSSNARPVPTFARVEAPEPLLRSYTPIALQSPTPLPRRPSQDGSLRADRRPTATLRLTSTSSRLRSRWISATSTTHV
eukprot:6184093-Pleurochrysis_carterae.AAC.1